MITNREVYLARVIYAAIHTEVVFNRQLLVFRFSRPNNGYYSNYGKSSGLKPGRQVASPGADGGPVAHVAGGQVFERRNEIIWEA